MKSVVLVEGGKKTRFEQELLAGCDPLVTLKNVWRVDINMKPCKKNMRHDSTRDGDIPIHRRLLTHNFSFHVIS